MSSESNPLPVALYQGLLDKLVAILELVQTSNDALTVQNKQALFQAVRRVCARRTFKCTDHHTQTTTFKNTLAQARELGIALPGGEMLTQEQDEVIAMLEELRDRKRCRTQPHICLLVFSLSLP